LDFKPEKTAATYAIAVWMAINILLMILLIANGDEEDLNNWIEIAFWKIQPRAYCR
jgi:cell division protein FtsW (lipid II flippase)